MVVFQFHATAALRPGRVLELEYIYLHAWEFVCMEVFLLNCSSCFLINSIPLQIKYYILDTVIACFMFVFVLPYHVCLHS